MEDAPSVEMQIDAAGRSIEVVGFVTLPCMNYDPVGNLTQIGSLLVLTVHTRGASTCATVPAVWRYSGRVMNLKPGGYTVRVVQPVPRFSVPSNPSEVVFEETFWIPE